MSTNRRNNIRVPDTRLITEIVSDRPYPASIVNMSATGIFTVKPSSPPLRERDMGKVVQFDIPIPEASESIWAAGKVVFESRRMRAMGAGIKFVAMANSHKRLLDEFVDHLRHEMMSQILREAKWRLELGAHPSPFVAPPPPVVHENTVKMYAIN